jgi:hypothetical protein
MAPILRRAAIGGESVRSVFELVTLVCRRETALLMLPILTKESIKALRGRPALTVDVTEIFISFNGESLFRP